MVLIRHTLFFIPGATAKAVSTGMMAPLSCNSLIGKLARYPGGFHALGPLGAGKSTINGDSAAGEAATKGWPFSIAAFDYSTAGEDLFPRVAWCCLWASDKLWISKLSLERSQCFQRRDRSQVGLALLLGSQRPTRLVRETSSPSIASHAKCLARHVGR